MTRPIAYMPVDTYPEAAPDADILATLAYAEAQGFGLHVTTFAVDVPPVSMPPEFLVSLEAMARAVEERSTAECERVRTILERAPRAWARAAGVAPPRPDGRGLRHGVDRGAVLRSRDPPVVREARRRTRSRAGPPVRRGAPGAPCPRGDNRRTGRPHRRRMGRKPRRRAGAGGRAAAPVAGRAHLGADGGRREGASGLGHVEVSRRRPRPPRLRDRGRRSRLRRTRVSRRPCRRARGRRARSFSSWAGSATRGCASSSSAARRRGLFRDMTLPVLISH